jgi:hypothetical protein
MDVYGKMRLSYSSPFIDQGDDVELVSITGIHCHQLINKCFLGSIILNHPIDIIAKFD